eukprot:CAMPEP_0118637816 /NCGR_PEP_ID=MMETSP0785-20121206/3352_1 /TAXON_ID=91992 /ORGANISM="Bolidomonas pacifica, Strain CCMP 1866" /LENGTH=166 /DNA_ID=CAMNT_0006529023 /DNA_START=26 /DNA_END=523 /DNA_ORIENTATION=+
MSDESQINASLPSASTLEGMLEAENMEKIDVQDSPLQESGIASYHAATETTRHQDNANLLIFSIGLRIMCTNMFSALKVFNETIGSRTVNRIRGTAIMQSDDDNGDSTTMHLMLESKIVELLTIFELLEKHSSVIACEVITNCGDKGPQQHFFFDSFTISHILTGN